MAETGLEKNLTGVAGEYAVCSQLALRSMHPVMTLKNFQSVDIIAFDIKQWKSYYIQVKTFGKNSEKINIGKFDNEHAVREKFKIPMVVVKITEDDKFRFFIIPKDKVADIILDGYRTFVDKPRSGQVKGFSEQPQTISLDQLSAYEGKWDNIYI